METLQAILSVMAPFWPYIAMLLLFIIGFIIGLSKSTEGTLRKVFVSLQPVAAFIKEGLSENGGGASSKRIYNAYIIALLIPPLVYVNIHMAKFHPELEYQYFWSTLLFIATVLGIQMTGKKDEIKDPNNAPDDGAPKFTPGGGR